MNTLPFRGRLLVRRLESFGDIVVGFSMSQLALQLGLPKSPEDLVSDPIRYVLFFGTFGVIALAWMRYHRMLTSAFAPHRIDLACAFAYLAFTALLPYALYANARLSHDRNGGRAGLATYTICLLGMSIAAFVMSVRSIGRARNVLSPADSARLKQRTVVEGGLSIIFVIGLTCDAFFGPARTSLVFLLIPVWARIVRVRYKAPGWSAVHVHGVSDAAETPSRGVS